MKNSVCPSFITLEEIKLKLSHLGGILDRYGYNAIVLNTEGAMRWLTGIKHQLGDIAPFSISPVNALVRFNADNSVKISFAAKSFELPRLQAEISMIFSNLASLEYELCLSLPDFNENTLLPDNQDYKDICDQIIRPLLSGFSGPQYAKLKWLSNMTMKVLVDTAKQLKPDMNGLQVRALLLKNLAEENIDANLVLICLDGQQSHLHPIASANYFVKKDKWLKLVVGSRFSEHIVSQSLMVKLGGKVTEYEQRVYNALQDSAVEYADCYREGKQESEIYKEMIDRFAWVAGQYDLKEFSKSAKLHHPGGGTSPLGNRDRMLDPKSCRKLDQWTQFAINPVDILQGFKVELQGIILPGDKPPFILDMSEYCKDTINFREVVSQGGTVAKLPELLIV